MDADDVDLIARIYDAALDPAIWPALLTRLAHKLGAAGAFVFEVQLDGGTEQVVSRMFSNNYDPVVVGDFLDRFNELELRDQGRFARLSAMTDPIELVSDIHLFDSVETLLMQENTRFMLSHGLKHRAGSLLNKDLLTIDRFALQFGRDRGPITEAEKRKALNFLPHVAKSIGLARPLEHQLRLQSAFERLINTFEQGVALLDPKGRIIYRNGEMERIMAELPVFRLSPAGQLQICAGDHAERYHALIADDRAHGRFGARARKEAIVVHLDGPGNALFIEICPAEDNAHTGHLGRGCRLLTVLDTSRPVGVDMERICTFYALSKAEADVLELIAAGRSNQDIADIRCRSLDTVKTQIRSLMRKTNSANRTDLIQMVRNLSAAVHYAVGGVLPKDQDAG
ncbi:MAG: helix-turn-helix domain-containing protein [Notoacmeibacter sp.]|nr:helix-turn-helix domain-containing protein [Notoacmeibacter sp.]MCC0033541.1 helix-turn-helix domain-containing protein [Brucellaceae bacterium]